MWLTSLEGSSIMYGFGLCFCAFPEFSVSSLLHPPASLPCGLVYLLNRGVLTDFDLQDCWSSSIWSVGARYQQRGMTSRAEL